MLQEMPTQGIFCGRFPCQGCFDSNFEMGQDSLLRLRDPQGAYAITLQSHVIIIVVASHWQTYRGHLAPPLTTRMCRPASPYNSFFDSASTGGVVVASLFTVPEASSFFSLTSSPSSSSSSAYPNSLARVLSTLYTHRWYT